MVHAASYYISGMYPYAARIRCLRTRYKRNKKFFGHIKYLPLDPRTHNGSGMLHAYALCHEFLATPLHTT